jgi:hypothetical protein
MAPIITHKDPMKELVTHVCTAQISVDEILTAAQEYFSGEVIKNVLWDFAEAEVDLRQPQIDKLMVYLRSLPPEKLEKRRGGRIAIVPPKEYVVGIMEQFKGWSELADALFEFQMFYDAEEALAWLESSQESPLA